MEPMVVIAARAATSVGQEILKAHQQRHRLDFKTSQKDPHGLDGLVTTVDTYADEKLVELLKKNYPTHQFLTEEQGFISGSEQDWQWIIDPLDGTTNFAHGFPHFCISLAVQHKGVTQHAVIYDPVKDELFTASKGKGATLNQRRIDVTNKKELKGSVIAVGQPYSVLRDNEPKRYINEHFASLAAITEEGASIRRSASAALDLAYVACGRFDAYFEVGVKAWDIAAGQLLVQEARGTVVDAKGGYDSLDNGQVFAASIGLIKPLMKATLPHLTYLKTE